MTGNSFQPSGPSVRVAVGSAVDVDLVVGLGVGREGPVGVSSTAAACGVSVAVVVGDELEVGTALICSVDVGEYTIVASSSGFSTPLLQATVKKIKPISTAKIVFFIFLLSIITGKKVHFTRLTHQS
jgi:hypothetical protein